MNDDLHCIFSNWKRQQNVDFAPTANFSADAHGGKLHARDEHGLGLDRTGSELKLILAESGLDRTEKIFVVCDYANHIKNFICNLILQIY